jgi:hypothetical protein
VTSVAVPGSKAHREITHGLGVLHAQHGLLGAQQLMVQLLVPVRANGKLHQHIVDVPVARQNINQTSTATERQHTDVSAAL